MASDPFDPKVMRRYIVRESLISALINGIISAGFFFLVFGGKSAVPVWGSGGLVADMAPQGFMVALMGTMVPGLLARKAVRVGVLAAPAQPLTAAHIITVAVAVAALAAGCSVAWAAAVGRFVPQTPSFAVTAAGKIAYGATLGWFVTGWSLRRLLRR